MTTSFGSSNMRTSLKQTRTNPSRTSKTAGSSLRHHSNITTAPISGSTTQQHGFYPAIMNFTDAITALPREFRRHTSLLKEVDAKAWSLEAHLQTTLAGCLTFKSPTGTLDEARSKDVSAKLVSNFLPASSKADAATHLTTEGHPDGSTLNHHESESLEHRKLFHNLRGTLTELMVSMDEKNHLINGANEDLSRHMKRLTTIYPHIAGEISEEARLGSLTHWAYVDNKAPTRVNGTAARRDAATGLTTMQDTDVASRSETRREAVLARKLRQNQVDSDIDDTRAFKRPNMNGKSKKVGETRAESIPGLGISTVVPASKRKKTEKAAVGAATEQVAGTAATGRTPSRERSQQEASRKRKAPATSATTAARKRINAASSATNSPKLASCPLVGSVGKDTRRNSPVPVSGRAQPARGRQNSAQGRPLSSASNKNQANGSVVSAGTPELRTVSVMTGKSTGEIRNTMKESVNNKGERLIEEGSGPSVNGTDGMKGGILLERSASKGGTRDFKREEASESGESRPKATAPPRVPPPVSAKTDVSLPGAGEGQREQRSSRARSSKTTTPLVNTFAESESGPRDSQYRTDPKGKRASSSSLRTNRSKDSLQDSLSPGDLPAKRSHKKGAGLAAQAAALQAKLAKQGNNKVQTADVASSFKALRDDAQAFEDNPRLSSVSPPTINTSATEQMALREADSSSINPQPDPKFDAAGGEGNEKVREDNEDDDNDDNDDAAAAAAKDEDEEDEPLDSSGEEPRYCYCQQVSYGEMVACDADDCPREWFHLECVGLGRAPGKNAKWFCEECKERVRPRASAGGGLSSGGAAAAPPGKGPDGGG